MSTTAKSLPQMNYSEVDEKTRGMIAAANRAAEKMIERKRRLGHKVVIYKDGKVLTVDP